MKNDEIKNYLLSLGASQIGFADISDLEKEKYVSGISIAIRINPNIVTSIMEGPTINYYEAYHSINTQLDNIAISGMKYIKAKGYDAIAQTKDYVQEYDLFRTEIPHKTIATKAGLGWIGKSALLVTEQYGSAIRLTSILTDMKFHCGSSIIESRCGDCDICRTCCPGQAINGKLWNVNVDRDEFFNSIDCRKAARTLSKARIDKEITLCGKCIEVCPYTQRYINKFSELT